MFKRFNLKFVGAFLLLAVLSGCATTFEKQAFNAELHKDIKNIGLINIQMPGKAMVNMAAHPGQSFGLIGGLVAAADISSKTSKYNEKMDEVGFNYDEYFRNSLKTALDDAGFTVSDVQVEREAQFKFLETYPTDTSTDGLLDVYVYNLGYGAAGATTNYYPTVHIHARLVLSETGEAIFADKVLYNNFGHRGEALLIDPSEEFAYKNFAALIDGIEGTTEGLKEAIDAVTAELAEQINQ